MTSFSSQFIYKYNPCTVKCNAKQLFGKTNKPSPTTHLRLPTAQQGPQGYHIPTAPKAPTALHGPHSPPASTAHRPPQSTGPRLPWPSTAPTAPKAPTTPTVPTAPMVSLPPTAPTTLPPYLSISDLLMDFRLVK